MRVFAIILGLCMCLMGGVAQAQQQKVWVQIDTQPTLSAAMDRARAYGALLDQVQGYALPSGFYAVVLGPMAFDSAVATMHSLLAQNMIAADSALDDGTAFGAQFWPVGAHAAPLTAQASDPTAADQTTALSSPTDPTLTDQTATEQPAIVPAPAYQSLGDARASEVGLTENDRRNVQSALKWFGFYAGPVDGSIGAGSRAAMANWQTLQGFDPTGVLTVGQRGLLIDSYQAEQSAFGLETVDDMASGVEISLPLAMVGFDSTSPPFVRYASKDGSGVTALLISQPGGTKSSLSGLYAVLQTLDIMPVVGERALESTFFTIQGHTDQIETFAFAQIVDGAVKGYVLSWPAANTERMRRVLDIMRASFRSTGPTALDPGLVPLDEAAKRGLLAGLSVKQPKVARTGFFIDQAGSVLTTLEAVDACGTITLDQSTGAKVSFADQASGLAVLTPDVALSPRSVAAFASTEPKVGAAVAVAGYSYGARLPAPVLTQGTLEEAQGLNGEPGLTRLALQALPGDAGGPVIDGAGVVFGMLLPEQASGGKQLPPGVAFAASALAIARILTNPQGPALTLLAATGGETPTPDALTAAARDMTVLVSCWD
ncbi:MAG: serine protease [Pseudomonadota bacterium]